MKSGTIIWAGLAALILLASGSLSAGPLTCLPGEPEPSVEDSDGDGIPDAEDRVPSDPSNACVDFDGDDLNDLREYFFGTDPANPDSDGDRIPDGWEVRAGMDPLDPNDALIDSDGDGVLNGLEVHFGTNPSDAASFPDLISPTTAGRYISYYTDEHQALGTSVIEAILDLRSDGTASFYPNGNLDTDADGGELTGSWDLLGPGIEVTFDPDQVLSKSANSRLDPDTGFLEQFLTIRYLTRRLILRAPMPGGRETWVVLSEIREEVPELGEVSTSHQFSKVMGAPVDGLSAMTFATETVYAMPCLGAQLAIGPRRAFSFGEYVDTYTCRLQFGPEGQVGTNLDSLTTFTPVGATPDGGFLVEDAVDDWRGTYYLIRDFGNVKLVGVLFEKDGKKWAWGDHVTARTESAWPAPADDRFQYYDWNIYGLGDFGFDFRSDGTVYSSSYDESLGDWRDSYRGSWYLENGNLVMERYSASTSPFHFPVRDPTQCDTEPCLLYDRRTMIPESLSSGELLFTHKWEFFEDRQDTDDDGIPDTSNLTNVEQGLRGFVRSVPDLDRDGVVDSIDLDDDGDGLPDTWEKDYFGESFWMLYERDGTQDPDDDGYTNLEEYERGTDPLMPDTEGPRSAFLALLRRGDPTGTLEVALSYSGSAASANQLIVFDALTGQELDSYSVPEMSRNVQAVTTVADIIGGDLDEIALLGLDDTPDRNKVFVRAAEDGSFIRNVNYLDSAWLARDAAGLPDLVGDGNPEIAVLASNVSTGEIAVQVRDSVTGSFVRNVFFLNPSWTPRQLLVLDDIDANPGEELGVLATNDSGQIVVMVKDANTNSFVRNVFFLNANWEPVQALVVDEFNGVSVPWIGLLAQNKGSGQLVFMVKNAATNQFLVNVFPLGSGWQPIKAVLLPDENGAGLELAVLGANKATGRPIVQVRDSSNGEFLRNVELLGANWTVLDMIALPDLGGGVPGLAVFAIREGDGVAVVQTINALTGEIISNTFLN